MKKLVILLAVVFTANVMMAQKMDRTNAYNYNRNGQYEKAIEAIEKCVNHQDFLGWGSKNEAQAWLYRGMIYYNVTQKPELLAKYPDAREKAFESLQRCIQTDAGYAKENADDIYSRINAIGNDFAQDGVNNFNNRVFDKAAVNFRKAYDISLVGSKPDTVALMNAGFSYLNANMYQDALTSYTDLKALGYEKADLYKSIAACYNGLGNDEMTMATIDEGLAKYPGDAGMIIERVNLFLKQGKGEDALNDLNTLHEMDPNNVSILFTLGNIFGDDTHEIFDADKAIGYYTRILEIDPTYNDANINLSTLYIKLAFKKQDEANSITDMSAAGNKKYNALREEANELLRTGLPYAEKTYQAEPIEEYKRILKMYYGQLNMMEELKALDAQ